MSKESCSNYQYGGQAVIEGVMMRGKKHFAVACRRVDGEITTVAENLEAGALGKLKWLNKPFLRGTLALVDSLVLGMRSLMWSANLALQDEQANDNQKTAESSGKSVNDIALSLTMFGSIALAIVLFMYVPAYLTKVFLGAETGNRAWLGLLEGGIKLAFFLLYVWGISHMKEIRRVFQYHGAEHKVINAFESGVPLTVDDVQKHTTVHVRCGTSFLLVVILVSIIVFAAIPWDFQNVAVWQAILRRVGFKLLLLPLVAGIAYEIIKLAGSRKESKLMRMILGPGLLMQRITTQEPTNDMVEVAISSLESVRSMEEPTKEKTIDSATTLEPASSDSL